MNNTKIVIYQSEDGKTKIQTTLENETLWLTQRKVERNTKYYNLDMIIALGYRVKSTTATQFRIWATNILKEYVVKGFAMNYEMLKYDYFDAEGEMYEVILEEQKQIANILSTADEKLEVLRAKKEKYETLKKGLLQKLLSGEIRC